MQVPTTISQSTLDELGQLIEDACERGDNVSAIAERAGVNRPMVSQLRNGTCVKSPTLDKVEAILSAIAAPSLGTLIRKYRRGR